MGLSIVWHPTRCSFDIWYIAQGLVAGANMVLVDFHPNPAEALVDGPQALTLDELPLFLEDVELIRETYLKRQQNFKAVPKFHA